MLGLGWAAAGGLVVVAGGAEPASAGFGVAAPDSTEGAGAGALEDGLTGAGEKVEPGAMAGLRVGAAVGAGAGAGAAVDCAFSKPKKGLGAWAHRWEDAVNKQASTTGRRACEWRKEMERDTIKSLLKPEKPGMCFKTKTGEGGVLATGNSHSSGLYQAAHCPHWWR